MIGERVMRVASGDAMNISSASGDADEVGGSAPQERTNSYLEIVLHNLCHC